MGAHREAPGSLPAAERGAEARGATARGVRDLALGSGWASSWGVRLVAAWLVRRAAGFGKGGGSRGRGRERKRGQRGSVVNSSGWLKSGARRERAVRQRTTLPPRFGGFDDVII